MDNKSEEHLTYEAQREQLEIWYRAHNIIREKAELYYDFLFSLLNLIDETYLGADVMQSEEDMMNHFTWCFNKVTSNFEQERIHFLTKNTHFPYLWFFFYTK
jgi:adenosine deaminase